MPHFVLLRKQRAVGHGFFHEATLRAVRGPAFRWVYDCGGGSVTEGQVAAYLEETKRAPVDLLFISHLHTDHVSGLPHLLNAKKGTKVRRVLLPHIGEVERILVAMRAVADGSMRPWFLKFLTDPVRWLRENGVDDVLEVVRGGDPAPEPRGGDDRGDVEDIRVTVLERGRPVPSGTTEVTDEAQVRVENETLTLNFQLYVQPAKLEVLEAFWAKLKGLGATPLEKLQTKPGRRDLRAAYDAGWPKRINWTSLCVACIPVATRGPTGHSWVEGHWHGPRHHVFGLRKRLGWLGLGDAVLKEQSEVDLLKKHFGVSLSTVGAYSLPHHGSDDNFCDDVMYLCSRPGEDEEEMVRYATARKGNSKHPSPSVKRTFDERAVSLCVVTEDPTSALIQGLVLER